MIFVNIEYKQIQPMKSPIGRKSATGLERTHICKIYQIVNGEQILWSTDSICEMPLFKRQ